MYTSVLILCLLKNQLIRADISQNEVGYLNELPIDKLLQLKNSLQVLVKSNKEYGNETTTATPPTLDLRVDNFGAQALGLNSPVDRADWKPPIKRGDEWDGLTKKGDHSKMSNIFSMAVTVLSFLAFGGYLLCLIVQAIRQKQNMNQMMVTTVAPATVFLNAGIKKRPHAHGHFSSSAYGRKKRALSDSYGSINLPPEQLFTALVDLCEGYARWSNRYGD